MFARKRLPVTISAMRNERLTGLLDKYGPYQRRMVFIIALPLIMKGYQTMIAVPTFYLPDHRCKIPGLDNDTFAIQDDVHRQLVNRSVPLVTSDGVTRFSRCQLYADNSSVGPGGRATEDCRAWVYDTTEFDRTIATQFDFVSKDKEFRATYNMLFMIGDLIGSPLSGFLCDRFGRRPFVIANFVGCIVLGVAATFPVLPEVLLFYRFLMGMAGTGMYLTMYILVMELMGPEHRNLSGTLMMVLWLIGPFLGAGLSFIVTDWRYLQLIGAAPFALCLTYIWLLPESPRWLLSKQRVRKAIQILKKVAKVNKLTFPKDAVMDESETEQCQEKHKNTKKQDIILQAESEDNQVHTNGRQVDAERKENTKTADEKHEGKMTPTTAAEAQGKAKDQPEQNQTKGHSCTEKKAKEKALPQESLLLLLKHPNFIARTGIIFFNWMVVTMTYYGLSLNVSNLGGSVRVNFLLSNMVELVGYIIAWVLLDRLGRKRLHCGVMLLAGIACLGTIFTVTFGGPDLQWLTTALAMVGKLGVSAAFSSIYLMTAELFPTVIRNLGLGCSNTVAKVAGAVSPYIADLAVYVEGPLGPALPLVVFGALALAAGLLALFLPETLHRTLPETLEDAANFTKRDADIMGSREDTKDPVKLTKV